MDTARNANDASAYILPGQCDLTAAARIHAALIEKMNEPVLLLDAGEVERCGTVVAQILVAASREVSAAGGHMQVRNMGPGFRKCFADLGLSQDVTSWE